MLLKKLHITLSKVLLLNPINIVPQLFNTYFLRCIIYSNIKIKINTIIKGKGDQSS